MGQLRNSLRKLRTFYRMDVVFHIFVVNLRSPDAETLEKHLQDQNLAISFRFISLGVSLLGTVNVVFEKSLISR